MNKEQRAAAKARCDAATEWAAKPDPDVEDTVFYADDEYVCGEVFRLSEGPKAEFIAHARTDLPMALAALDEKDAEIERLRAALDEVRNTALMEAAVICDRMDERYLKRYEASGVRAFADMSGAVRACGTDIRSLIKTKAMKR